MTCGADLMKGHSGGPIFGFWSNGPGSWLPKLVSEARSLDP
jgi:hypothetical protein